jgi:hypothetical protein
MTNKSPLGYLAMVGLMIGLSTIPACTSSGRSGSSERAVYSAVLEHVLTDHHPWLLAVQDSTIALPPTDRATAEDWIRAYDAVPSNLRVQLRTVSSQPRSVRRLDLPPTITFARKTVDRLDSGNAPWLVDLQMLATGNRGILGFSPVAFSPDTSQAFVYYTYHCGGLCGHGVALWLLRHPGGQWHVAKEILFWVS